MPIPSDDTIRLKVAEVIEAAAPLAVVYPWWVLDDEGQWLAVLKTGAKDFDSAGNARVHGYVMIRQDTDGRLVGNHGARRTYIYQIAAFHYFFMGTKTNNSEKLFSAEIDAVAAAFDAPTPLSPLDVRLQKPIHFVCDVKPKRFSETLHTGIADLIVEGCG